jgi:hypothetical protein
MPALRGRNGTNLGMAIIREYLAAKGLGLHQAIVGNRRGDWLRRIY